MAVVEMVREWRSRPPAGCVLFDFDGTLSLIRQGWPEVMVEMFLELLPPREGRSRQEDRSMLLGDMMRLAGRQTIHQMIRFAERVRERGREPEDPLRYKRRYLDLLDRRIAPRLERLRSGECADSFLLHGSRPLLERLRSLGLPLYLASGTDEDMVRREARLLEIDGYFEGRIHGAVDDWRSFSKRKAIGRILSERSIGGERLLSFGDGFVEIEETRRVGGLAVGVASDEARNGSGRVDRWKRRRLLEAGADAIVPDYREGGDLADLLLARDP